MTIQRTLRRSVSCSGIGLHSGRKVTLRLKPAPADHGIRFKRLDLDGLEVPAVADRIAGISYATGLAQDAASVGTVEHLLAALVGLGVDNVSVELNQAEVPIMDGSAASFVYLVHEAGVRTLKAPRRFLKVVRPIALSHGNKRIAVYASDHFKVTYSISFDHPLLRHQSRTQHVTEETFAEEIAPARTFGFLKEVEQLRKKGLALGGSLDNAIVLGETGFLNNTLRFEDEFVRHKILDVIGDLALVGHPIIGHVVAHRGGHALHAGFARKILEESDAWRLVEFPVGTIRRSRARGEPRRRPGALGRLGRQLAHVRAELLVLVGHRVQEQALEQVRLTVGLRHLADEVADLLHRIFEAVVEPVAGVELAVERLQDREQVAVEGDLGPGRGLYRAHGHSPKLPAALASSACSSMKLCAPVMVSIVSTRFCTPESLIAPPSLSV